MLELYKNIKRKRQELQLSQEDLAKKTGYKDRTSIAKIEKGLTDLSQSKILAFANALGVSPTELMGYDLSCYSHPDILPIKTKKLPLLGEIACGKPIPANREYSLYEVDENINADFCIRARGDSMINARINDGDIVFIKECVEVYNGEIAAVVIDDSVTLKRVYLNKEKGQLILNAENPSYSPIIYTNEELRKIRILGRAVGFQSALK